MTHASPADPCPGNDWINEDGTWSDSVLSDDISTAPVIGEFPAVATMVSDMVPVPRLDPDVAGTEQEVGRAIICALWTTRDESDQVTRGSLTAVVEFRHQSAADEC